MNRPDRTGTHRTQYEAHRRRLMQTQRVCGICGRPIDTSLKPPHPLAPCVDHIIPVSKGGHPSDLSNLQLAHWSCNRAKSDKLFREKDHTPVIGNRNLPQSRDWAKYRSQD